MWSIARRRLALSSDEFWALSPKEFFALLDVWTEDQRMANVRAGLAASAVYNVNRKPGSKPMKPLDFFEEPEAEDSIASADEIHRQMDQLARTCRAWDARFTR